MSSVDEFNFEAPQYVESLANIEEVDDGADNFFDAVDNVYNKPPTTTDEKVSSLDNIYENIEKPKDDSENVVDKHLSNDGNIENQDISKKIEPAPRHTRQSLKKLDLPLRRSLRYTSVAEHLHKFQHATPPRFKRKSGVFHSKNSKFLPTIAHSPRLQTKLRARKSTAPSVVTEERPVLKPIRRNPVQAKPPTKPAPRPTTVPQPFKLTESSKFKKLSKEEEDRPEVPKRSTSSTKVTPKPVNVKKKALQMDGNKLILKEQWAISGLKTLEKPNMRTKVVPFSFEQRNQERLKAKQLKSEQAKENHTKENSKTPAKNVATKFRQSTSLHSETKKQRLTRPSLQQEAEKK